MIRALDKTPADDAPFREDLEVHQDDRLQKFRLFDGVYDEPEEPQSPPFWLGMMFCFVLISAGFLIVMGFIFALRWAGWL